MSHLLLTLALTAPAQPPAAAPPAADWAKPESAYLANIKPVTTGFVRAGEGYFSPDGKQIAVVHGENNRYRIGLVNADNGELFILTNGRLDESPSFAPNGAQIIYATREGNRGVLASVSTDGRIKTQIASVAGDVQEPVWGPFPRP